MEDTIIIASVEDFMNEVNIANEARASMQTIAEERGEIFDIEDYR